MLPCINDPRERLGMADCISCIALSGWTPYKKEEVKEEDGWNKIRRLHYFNKDILIPLMRFPLVQINWFRCWIVSKKPFTLPAHNLVPAGRGRERALQGKDEKMKLTKVTLSTFHIFGSDTWCGPKSRIQSPSGKNILTWQQTSTILTSAGIQGLPQSLTLSCVPLLMVQLPHNLFISRLDNRLSIRNHFSNISHQQLSLGLLWKVSLNTKNLYPFTIFTWIHIDVSHYVWMKLFNYVNDGTLQRIRLTKLYLYSMSPQQKTYNITSIYIIFNARPPLDSGT